MNNEILSESTTCLRYIDPKLQKSKWLLDNIVREYPITKGKITPKGKTGKRNNPLKADYILRLGLDYKIAVVEAKAYDKFHDDGMQQAINYAKKLNLKFAYSTNGKKIEEYNFITKQQRTIDSFPTPQELQRKMQTHNELDDEKMQILLKPFDKDSNDPKGDIIIPRYYQEIAINEALTSILNGKKKRILLTLATGTGKTFIAYQIAKKLWKNNRPRPKILFLADRNILLNQAKTNAFASFGGARHRIQGEVETAYEMYFSLYQSMDVDKEEGELYKQYSSDFFDYVIIDECHRGISTESNNWRQILEHFSSAIHIGMTATPKHDKDNTDTYDYFGTPVYTYSLKQGIEDGFLAPYIINRVNLDIDIDGYMPESGEVDLDGKILENRRYTYKDFDRVLIVNERRKFVARHLVRFLEKNEQKLNKTILFCQNSEHALAMTKLIRSYSNEKDDYCVRIVSAEGELGREYLSRFQNTNDDFPVVAVTSKLLSTGVDIPTCKVIALDKSINSITEFKQIIGRGTRVFESKDKMWFSIIDYRKATRLFEDEDWDGPAIEIIDESLKLNSVNFDPNKSSSTHTVLPRDPKKPYEESKNEIFHIDGKEVKIQGETVVIFDQSIGRNRIISYQDYTGETVRRLINDKERGLKNIWINPNERKHFIQKLEERGITFEHLQEITKLYKSDAFDLLMHFAFNFDAKTRLQRVDSIRNKSFLEKYPAKAREVISVILDHYAEHGYQELEDGNLLTLPKFEKFGGQYNIITNIFGNRKKYDDTIMILTKQIYSEN